MLNQLKIHLEQLKQHKPLILCLTNYVTMDFVANSILALGASPLMSQSQQELGDLIHLSQAIYINIGTLDEVFIEKAIFAASLAHSLKLPIVLDPVGCGASVLRTVSAQKLYTYANVIRGNASEIIALNDVLRSSRSLESNHTVAQAIDSAWMLANKGNKIIIISGPQDFVTDGIQRKTLEFGSSIMPFVTGMGCALTGVIASFLANSSNYFQSATLATAYYALCGQLAEAHSTSPGSFKYHFIDMLYHPNWELLEQCTLNSNDNI